MATELVRKIRGTRSELGKKVREEFVESTARDCEPLVFEDLQKGDKFIFLPTPGDNGGHGGLLSSSFLLLKTEKICHPEFPTNCIRLCDGTSLFARNNEFVLKVE